MMQRYEKYKDSEFDWIGGIPEHWSITSWRRITTTLTDYTANGSFADLKKNVEYKNEPDFARLVRLTDLRKGIQDSNEGVWISEDAYKYLKKSALFGGEFLIANVGAYSGIVFQMPYIDQPASLAPNMMMAKFDQNKIDNRYIFYAANSFYIQEPLRITALSSAQPKLNKDDFKGVIFIVPPLEEQKAIASYLDHKTSEVDQLIAQKERLIELYEEEKTAIINEAVTKGINPDVKLKPSGIDWLGDIPEHWRLNRLKHSCSVIFLGLTGKVDYVENQGFPLVRANNITNQKLDLSNVRFISEKQHRELTKKNKTRRDDILLTKSGSIGVAALVNTDEEFSIYESIFTLRAKKEIVKPKFLLYFLRSRSCKAQYEKSIVGMGVGHLNMGDIVDVVMSIPTLEEQKTIAHYIEKESLRIDAKIAKTTKIIELQKEYRTALISEAVTGKIKVPTLSQ